MILFILFLFISCGSEVSVDLLEPRSSSDSDIVELERPFFYSSQKLRKNASEILSSWDRFGSGVALNEKEDVLVVSAWSDEVVSEESGSIRIYKKVLGKWEEISNYSLEIPDISNYKKLGKSLALSATNNRIAAGLENLNNTNSINTGGIYLYWDSGSGIEFKQRITLDHITLSDEAAFGRHVEFSYDGEFLFVNALKEDVDGTIDAGALYIFKYNSDSNQYVEWQKIKPPVGYESFTQFGTKFSISKDKNTLIITHPLFNQDSENVGMIFKYTLGNGEYILKDKLISPVDQENYKFGRDVVCFKNCETIAVRAQETVGGLNLGKVYILNQDLEINRIINPPEYSVNGNTYFGMKMAFNPSGSLLAISSTYRFDSRYTGKVYIYETDNFTIQQELKVNQVNEKNNASSTYFGISLFFGNDNLVVGSHTLPSVSLAAEGAVVIFEPRSDSVSSFFGKSFKESFDFNNLLGLKLFDSLTEEDNRISIDAQNLISYNEYKAFRCLELVANGYVQYSGLNFKNDMSLFFSFYNHSDELDKTILSSDAFSLKTDSSDEDRLVLSLFRGSETVVYTTDNLAFHADRWNQIQINFFTNSSKSPEVFINGLMHILNESGDSPTQKMNPMTNLTLGSTGSNETKHGCINEIYFTDVSVVDPLEFSALKY